jgi:monovalent cation:H+ antiporter-2, CPA2 family
VPHDFLILKELLILLAVSLPVVFLCGRLRLPAMIGFMISGVVIGPFGLALIQDASQVEILAEIGVCLLLFTVGLEFSLRRILEMRRTVFFGGGLQVALTTIATTAIFTAFGRPVRQAIFIGFLVALSSTAIVLKTYVDRAEIDTPHGGTAVGVLLFQDLCVVPMMLLTPVLGGKEGASALGVGLALGKATAAVAIIVGVSHFVAPLILRRIVALRSRETFVGFIVLMSLGTAWLTSQFGLSLALGAFLAGLTLSESEYSHQIVADILPFRDIFNGIFFISVGMLLSLGALASNFPVIAGLVAALIAGKTLLAALAVSILGRPLRIAVTTALGLAQIGEFSFILIKVGVGYDIVGAADYQTFLAASILSMIATPFLIAVAPRAGFFVANLTVRNRHAPPSMSADEAEAPFCSLRGHVVIAGFGLNGRNLARTLRKAQIAYHIIELNAEAVRQAKAEGELILFGDCTQSEVLHAANVERARILVVAISDPTATRRICVVARALNPAIHIIVRTRFMAEMADLHRLGVNQVVPEEFETSLEIFSRVLREYGVARRFIQREVEEIRREGYRMLGAEERSQVTLTALTETLNSAATETIRLDAASPAVGKTLAELEMRKRTGATVIVIQRDGRTELNPNAQFRFAVGDILVCLGTPDQLELATNWLLAGDA